MRKIIALLILTQCCNLSAQTILYVNQSVAGGQQNGTNWANAFTDLQSALGAAVYGDQIWVAKGTYYPTATTDRNISFELKNGVKMFGGFQGMEVNLNERDFGSNETVLSGNIGEPKGSDNTYNVLYGEGLDSTTILDGFVVTKGVANGSEERSATGGGLLLNPSPNVYNTCPMVQNCRFEANYAKTGGGVGIPRWHFSQNYVNPTFRNCQFVSNRAALFGGALAKVGPALSNFPFIVENCTFLKNASGQEGGGIYLSKTENTTVLRKCFFQNDTSNFSSGGGVYIASGYEELIGAKLTMELCSFKENIATEGGGFYFLDGGIPSFSTPPFSGTFSSCVFEKNVATGGYGGAFGFIGFDKSSYSVDVVGCEFNGNLSHVSYIGYFQAGNETNCKVHIRNCKYVNNKDLETSSNYCYPISFGIGGPGSRLDAWIENCLFSGNGGAVSSLCTLDGGGINTYISNCTFYNNNEYLFNKSYYSTFNGIDHFANVYLNNCVIWQPGASIWTMFSDNNFMIQKLDGYHVDHSLLSQDSSTTNAYPIFGNHNISETDPLFVDVLNGDFRLDACSPAVNAGNNLIVDTLGLLTDLDGNPRIRFETVDIGAYETQDSCFTIGAKTPIKAAVTAIIWPNPAAPGQSLDIQVAGMERQSLEWSLLDAWGRPVSFGTELLFEKEHFSVASPASPGLYLLEIQAGGNTVWRKFVVQ